MRWILRLLPPNPRIDGDVSMWSIPIRDAGVFFPIAGCLWVAALGFVVYKVGESWPRGSGALGWREAGDFAIAVLVDFGAVALAIAVVALLLTRTVTIVRGMLMTLYQAMVNRFVIPVIEGHKAEGRVEGRVEGRAEERAEWQAWNDRRIEAERDGREFDEPPPGG